MASIPLVDINAQHREIKEELNAAVNQVIDSGKFINGPEVREFEESLANYLGAEAVIGCGNGTDALQLALMGLDIPGGAEVIIPDFSFISTAEVVKVLGLKPVLVDIDPDTFNIDPTAVRSAISENTWAIIPVHLFGQCAPMEEVMAIAEDYHLYVIEDVAQALGADYYWQHTKFKAGTIGKIGCTSFFPVKNLGCMGDGGALITNDADLAEKLRSLKQHGMSKPYTYDYLGMNSRLDTIQAAILNVKLPYLDLYNQSRQFVADQYDQGLSSLTTIKIPENKPYGRHVYQQYTLRVKPDLRDDLKQYLAEKGIPTKVFYPAAIHEHPIYRKDQAKNNNYSNSLRISREVLSLPIYPEIKSEDIRYIIEVIQQYEKA